MPPGIVIALIAGIVVFAVVAIALSLWMEGKRTRELQSVAQDLGFDFRAEGAGRLSDRLSGFDLMNRGTSRRYRNVMQRAADGRTVSLFDYQYTISTGKNSTTHRQTVAVMESANQRLPSFSMAPEGLLHRVGQLMGMQDIDFDDAPRFSRAFVLRGDDESAIRQCFGPEMLEQIPEFGAVSIAGEGDLLMVWFAGRRKKPAELRTFFESAFRLHLLFCERML